MYSLINRDIKLPQLFRIHLEKIHSDIYFISSKKIKKNVYNEDHLYLYIFQKYCLHKNKSCFYKNHQKFGCNFLRKTYLIRLYIENPCE